MNRFKELRVSNTKTQSEVANYLKITQSNYSKYELGTIEPDLDTLYRLADYYNVSLDYLCGRRFNNDLGFVTDKQKELFKMIQTLDNDKFFMVYGYVARLLNEAVI